MLNEGLIKVPRDLLRSICESVISQFISYAYGFKEHRKYAKKLARVFNVQIDTEFKPVNREIELETTLDGIPERIKSVWNPEYGHLKLVVDWEQKIWRDRPKVNASYEETPEKGLPGYFTINPRSIIEILNSPNFNKDDLVLKIRKFHFSVWHEVSHGVQHNALKWLDPNQVKKERRVRDNPESSPEEKRNEYLTQDVEFDPQIKSRIFLFNEKYENSNINETRKNLAIFTGGIESEEEPDEYFLALKNTDPQKWRKAVKIFYRNYSFDWGSFLKEIYTK
jgi:hypothetical protein